MQRFAICLLILTAIGCDSETSTPRENETVDSGNAKATAAAREHGDDIEQHVHAQKESAVHYKESADFVRQLAALMEKVNQQDEQHDFAASVQTWRQLRLLVESQYGAESWQGTSARLGLSTAQKRAALETSRHHVLDEIAAAERQAHKFAQQNQSHEAATEYRRAAELAKSIYGPRSHVVANLALKEAREQEALAEFAEAERLYLETTSVRLELMGRDHPDYLEALSALGVLYHATNQHPAAEPLLLEAAAVAKQIWGEHHADVATHLNNLGALYYDTKDYDRALQVLGPAAEIRQRVLSDEHPAYAHCLFNLGSVHLARKEVDEAVTNFERALPPCREALGATNKLTMNLLSSLGAAYTLQKNHVQAETVLRELVENQRQAVGPDHPEFALALFRLAVSMGNQGKYSDAEPLLVETIRLQQQTLSTDDPQYVRTLETYAALLRKTGRPESADRLESQAKSVARRNPNGSDRR